MITKLLTISSLILVFSVSTVIACGCGGMPDDRSPSERLRAKIDQSAAAFTGKVVGFEYRPGIYDEEFEQHLGQVNRPRMDYEVKFVKIKIDRWWAGDLGEEVELMTAAKRMADGTTSNSSCDYGFEEGKTYFVFANKRGLYLSTHSCAGNAVIKDRKEVVELIGPGKAPIRTVEN